MRVRIDKVTGIAWGDAGLLRGDVPCELTGPRTEILRIAKKVADSLDCSPTIAGALVAALIRGARERER